MTPAERALPGGFVWWTATAGAERFPSISPELMRAVDQAD